MKMKKLKLYSIAFAFIFQYGLLSAQSLLMNCGNSLEDVVNSKHLTEGENEICSLSEGKINLVVVDIICGTDASGNLKFCKHKICFPCN